MADPFSPSLYAWSSSPLDPNLQLRRALGIENKWVRMTQAKQPQCLMYLSGTLSFQTPIKPSEFAIRAEKAWLALRWQCPEVVLKPHVPRPDDGSDGKVAMMECRIPPSEQDAIEWARNSLSFNFAEAPEWIPAGKAVAYLRTRRAELMVQPLGDPVALQFTNIEGEKVGQWEEMRGVEYAFCVDHACTDGVGAHIIAGRYFGLLAEYLGGSVQDERKWAECVENLHKPWVGIMNKEQKTEGPEFEGNIQALKDQVMSFSKSDWGLTATGSNQWEPNFLPYTFSEEDTSGILRACKEKLGISVTHLGHAATVVAAFRGLNVDSTIPDGLTSPLFINGRRYLDPDQATTQEYIPLCRAIGFIEFSDVKKLALPDRPSKAEIRKALSHACEEARYSYEKIRNQKSILTESFSGDEYMASAKLVKSTKGQPIFMSDGITEKYIQRSYFGPSREQKVISVDEAQFVADPGGPSLAIRIGTFRNKLRLSPEWNAACTSNIEVQDFVNEVMLLMRAVN